MWSGNADHPVVVFLLYLFVLDFFEYWYHRAQHTYTLILAAEMLFKLDDSSNFGMLVPSDAEGLRAYTCP